MGSILSAFTAAWRDYVSDGVESSGEHQPNKADLRALGSVIEAALGVLQLGGMADIHKDTRANLEADLAHAANTVALVYNDATDANNDFYIKSGASGSGSWTKTTILADAVGGASAATLTAAAASATAAAASAVDAANYAAVSRNKLINLGEAQAQDVATAAKTGFLMTSITSPATRRTITRAADKITIATTLGITTGVVFEKSDQADGRLFSAEFVMTAGASTRSVGIGFTTPARADTARADASQITAVDIDPVATNDTLLFALRQSGGAHCVFQSVANAPATETTKIAFSSFTAFPVTWANGDTVRAVAYVPNDATTQRRVDFFIKPSTGSTFTFAGYILINAADWPVDMEMWAGSYSTGSYTVEIAAATMTVSARVPEYPAKRYMQASAALIGLGTRTEPVSDLRQLFHSVDEGSDNLRAMIGANGGNPYRITNSNGFSFPWDRFREITLEGDAGAKPKIRGSIPPVSAWTLVSGNVWATPNRFNNTTSTTNGAVICYDTSELAGFHLPGTSTRVLHNAGVNASTATLNALTIPSFSVQASGNMHVMLPGGVDPNDIDLELVQCADMLTFAGPSTANLLWRPRLTLRDLTLQGGTTSVLKLQVWDYELDRLTCEGNLLEALLQEECGGRSYNLVLAGTNADNHKINPYTGAGGSSYYSDADRPVCTHWDAGMYAAGIAGSGSAVDNTSLHRRGGKQIYHNPKLWDATKHNMSQIDGFEVHGGDLRRGAQGGCVVAFDANVTADFAIMDCLFTDCGSASLGAIIIDRAAGTGTTTGVIKAPTIVTPGGARRGIQIGTAGASAGQMVISLIDPMFDSAISVGDRRVNFAGATVTERSLVA